MAENHSGYRRMTRSMWEIKLNLYQEAFEKCEIIKSEYMLYIVIRELE